MSAESLAVEPARSRANRRGDGAPRWRVAVLYHQDEQAPQAAEGIVEQLRAGGCTATPIEVPLSDPFVDHHEEWQGRVSRGAYDLVFLVGRLTPPAMAFAVLADTPILRGPSGEPLLIGAIETAMAGGYVEEVAVAEIALDRVRRFFTGVVRIAADDAFGFECTLAPSGRPQTLRSCAVRPSAASDMPLEVHLDGAEAIPSEHVEITGRPGTLVVELDGRSRRTTIARIGAAPQPLKILRTGRNP